MRYCLSPENDEKSQKRLNGEGPETAAPGDGRLLTIPTAQHWPSHLFSGTAGVPENRVQRQTAVAASGCGGDAVSIRVVAGDG